MVRHLVATLAFVSMVPFARVWDPLGHMLMKKIAYGEMTPKAREELDVAVVRPV